MEREQERSGLIRRLVTILSADVAGYSRLMAVDESRTLMIFREYKKIFEALVAHHRGRVFNTAGDAILAEFPSAVEAVRCATEIQAALRTANARYPDEEKVQFRIGINLGDVIEQGTDLLGDGVNIAARVQTAAEPGGICISGGVYDQISSKLQLLIESMGEKSYKNIPQPVRTFSVAVSGGVPPRVSRGNTKQILAPPTWFRPAWLSYGAGALALVGIAFIAFGHRPAPFAPQPLPPPVASPADPQPAAAQPLAVQPLPVPEKLDLVTAGVRPDDGEARWTVDPNGQTGAPKTINEALARSSAGDVIAIRPGVYKEHLALDKKVTLRGLPGADGRVGVRIEFEGDDTITVSGGEVGIENVGVVLKPSPGAKTPAALLVLGGKVRLRNVSVFCGGDHPAIAFSLRAGEVRADASEFTGQRGIEQLGGRLDCDACTAESNREEGVVVFNQAGEAEFSSVFRHLKANRNGKQGVAVMGGVRAELSDCQINGNGTNGADVLAGGSATLTGCEVLGNKENGVVGAANAKITFIKGKASRNTFSGVAVINNASLTIRDSELTENGEFGFATLDAAIAQSENNSISGNRGGSSYRAPASEPAAAAFQEKK